MIVDIEKTDNETDTGTDTDNGGPATKTGFLKLYDRRFARSMRSQEGVGKWRPAIENIYVESIRTGSIQQFAHDLRHVEGFRATLDERDDLDVLDTAQREAYANDTMVRDYTTEVSIYNALHDQQGKLVPRLLAAVDLDLTPPGAENDELFHIKGILLEHIEGFPMSRFTDKMPPSTWQNIVDQAIAAVHVLGDHYIMDSDRRPENFIVRPDKNGEFRITEGEADEVGMVWQKELAIDHGFHLNYEQSDRYLDVGLEYARALAQADIDRYEREKAEATKAKTTDQEES
ncbi:hypothetical protein F5144DRAFT_497990 [Chaetomium tenue]|uniref:Uncharacterized protein n=1 Tax=Chaetomium tenue TaxID=1854479 RepID=A0ACB7P1U2_9PEZI|nr:hypothetical protein F5144DRAFT_497990 [Chaetomium globosum]